MQNPVISILGIGALGSALAADLTRNGYEIEHLIVHNNLEDVSELLRYKAVRFEDLKSINSDILFITVKDDMLGEVATQLSKVSDLNCNYFIHCSGALTSEILKPLKEKGSISAFHPMKSFVKGQGNTSFIGVYVDIETGSDDDYESLRTLAESMGAIPFRIDKDKKIKLHAAASMISNFSVALADMATKLVDIDDSEISTSALAHLMYQTAGNISEIGSEEAVTGPIKRGDAQIVKEHLESIKSNDLVLKTYLTLGKHTISMVEESGVLSTPEIKALKAVFEEYE